MFSCKKASSDKPVTYSLPSPGVVINYCLPLGNGLIKTNWAYLEWTLNPITLIFKEVFPFSENRRAAGQKGGVMLPLFKFPVRFRGHCCELAIPFPLLWALRTSVWASEKRACCSLVVMHADLHSSHIYKMHLYFNTVRKMIKEPSCVSFHLCESSIINCQICE